MMSSSIPSGFEAIYTAKSRTRGLVNIIGVVVDALPSKKTNGPAFVSTFTLKDSDFSSESWRGLKVRYFHDEQSYIPAPSEGDVVILRNIKLSLYQGATIGLSTQTHNSPWNLFKRGLNRSSPQFVKGQDPNTKPSPSEKEYALFLLDGGSASYPSGAPQTESPKINQYSNQAITTSTFKQATSHHHRKKFALIKDAKYGTFIDIIGQVVKTFPEGDKFTVYITDYTNNKHLFNYTSNEHSGRDGDEFNYTMSRSKRQWPGPFGQMTLQVTLWEPHSYFAQQNVNENDFVSLKNVHIKASRQSGSMEGALHTDRMYPHKVQMNILDDNEPNELVKELVKRKIDYWRKLKSQHPGSFDDGSSKRHLGDTNTMDKREKKKKKKQAKKKPQNRDPDQPEITPLVQVKRDELNTHIRSHNPAIPNKLIRDILEGETHTFTCPGGTEYKLPFQNLRYKASVRVVDFFPPTLEDFAVQYNPEYAMISENNIGSSSGDSDGDQRVGPRRWEWRFCLLVEDGGPGAPRLARGQKRERMQLFVGDADAVFLHGLDATDLRRNPEVLAELREKLFILWGDLEERKSANPETFNADDAEAVSAKPFVCCIKEYGVQTIDKSAAGNNDNDKEDARGDKELNAGELNISTWEKHFRMFGTTIL